MLDIVWRNIVAGSSDYYVAVVAAVEAGDYAFRACAAIIVMLIFPYDHVRGNTTNQLIGNFNLEQGIETLLA